MIGPYQTARAFRAALEERLKRAARNQHTDLMRLRRQVAFDRLLARLFATPDVPWVLKGGYTFELRLGGRARATKDLDLSVPDLHRLATDDAESFAPSDAIRERLQEVAAADSRLHATARRAHEHARQGSGGPGAAHRTGAARYRNAQAGDSRDHRATWNPCGAD